MVAGAPKTKDYLAEAIAIEEWSLSPDATALCQFAVLRDVDHTTVYHWRDTCVEFANALKKARTRIAANLRRKLHDKENPYNYGLFQRDIKCHDKFLVDDENEVDFYREKKIANIKANATEKAKKKYGTQDVSGILNQHKQAIESLINDTPENK